MYVQRPGHELHASSVGRRPVSRPPPSRLEPHLKRLAVWDQVFQRVWLSPLASEKRSLQTPIADDRGSIFPDHIWKSLDWSHGDICMLSSLPVVSSGGSSQVSKQALYEVLDTHPVWCGTGTAGFHDSYQQRKKEVPLAHRPWPPLYSVRRTYLAASGLEIIVNVCWLVNRPVCVW